MFSGWTNQQTININLKQSEIPSGWQSGNAGNQSFKNWNNNCYATINYLPE